MSDHSVMADPNRLPPSLWTATAAAAPRTAPLEGDESADILVIGAGYAGLSSALRAAESGASVCVLEAGDIGWGAQDEMAARWCRG